MRTCFSCKREKPEEEFYADNSPGRSEQRECKECCRERRAKWWKSARGKRSSANSKLKARFGLSIDEYEELLAKQEGKCKICGALRSSLGHRLAVDHNHETGEIRGLLCKSCNIGIGNLQDDPELCERAAVYLRGEA